jgi:hypothetical protein
VESLGKGIGGRVLKRAFNLGLSHESVTSHLVFLLGFVDVTPLVLMLY